MELICIPYCKRQAKQGKTKDERCGGGKGETIMHTERDIYELFRFLNSCHNIKVTEHHSSSHGHAGIFMVLV